MTELLADDLSRYRDLATTTLQRAAAISDPRLADLRSEIESLAREVLEDAAIPVRIGILGEPSAGRSLILGTLLGNPLLLAQRPAQTADDILVIKLTQSAGDGEATVLATFVDYLDHDELGGYLAKMSVATTRHALADAVATAPLADLRALTGRRGAGQAPDFTVSTSGYGPGPQRNALQRELDALTSALHAPSWPLPDCAELDDLSDLTRQAAVQPLIRRVRMSVEVPVWAWNLAEFYGAPVHLVDIPVAHYASAIRAVYLAELELAEMTTALVILDAGRPADSAPAPIGEILSATWQNPAAHVAGMLVALGKFDTVTASYGDLLGDGGRAGSARPDETASSLPTAGPDSAVWRARQMLTPSRDERIAFASSYVAIARARANARVRWQPENVISVLGCGPEVDRAADLAEAWLRADLPANPLGDALGALADDGGFTRLAGLITKSVTESGLSARVLSLRDRVERLAMRNADLERLQMADDTAEQVDVGVSVHARLRAAIGDLTEAYGYARRAVHAELGDPHSATDDRPSLHDRICQQASIKVLRWPQWWHLFDAVQGRTVVVGFDERDREVPVMAADFAEPFRRTCVELERWASEAVADVANGWLAAWFPVQARTGIARLIASQPDWPAEVIMLTKAGENFLGSGYLAERTRQRIAATAPPEAVRRAAFPLDERRSLPWHPGRPRRMIDNCDAIMVPRLRREMVNAAATYASQYLTRLQSAACDEIADSIRQIERKLSDADLSIS